MSKPVRILRLDASANPGESTSRKLGDRLLERLEQVYGAIEVTERDLNHGLDFIDDRWIEANFTDADGRDPGQRETLRLSDRLIEEVRAADHIVLTTPMYNFGVPATLKTWIDLVCRAGVTFRYTDDGPVGLLTGKQADIIVTTGGAPLKSPVDFVSGYLRQIFNFIGIEDVTIIGADRMNVDADASFAGAQRQIDQHYAASNAREQTWRHAG